MKVKKRIVAVVFVLVLMLAGCGQGTDNISSDRMAQDSEVAVQESASSAQTESEEGGIDNDAAEVPESGSLP